MNNSAVTCTGRWRRSNKKSEDLDRSYIVTVGCYRVLFSVRLSVPGLGRPDLPDQRTYRTRCSLKIIADNARYSVTGTLIMLFIVYALNGITYLSLFWMVSISRPSCRERHHGFRALGSPFVWKFLRDAKLKNIIIISGVIKGWCLSSGKRTNISDRSFPVPLQIVSEEWNSLTTTYCVFWY